MTNTLQAVTVKIPLSDLRRIPEPNRSEFIRSAVSEKLARQPASGWKPKTATGRKLLALREKFIRSGGELLDSEGIANELKQRRGGAGVTNTFITSEKPGKPMFSVPGIRVISLHSLKNPPVRPAT